MRFLGHFAPILFLAASVGADKAVDESRPADGNAEISISNVSGSVRVRGWNRDQVEITGSLGDDTEGLSIEGDRNSLKIEVKIPEGRGMGRRDTSADLEVRVPAGSRLEVKTVSANIQVAETHGRLKLRSVSGSVRAEHDGGEASLQTVSGSVELRGSRTSAEVESVSGRLELTGVAGQVEASTVSGSLRVSADGVDRGKLSSVSGSVHFSGDLSPGARLEARSTSGSITLAVPERQPASYEITTFSGSIRNDFGPEPERNSRYAPGKTLKFSVGSGGAEISANSHSGSVRLQAH